MQQKYENLQAMSQVTEAELVYNENKNAEKHTAVKAGAAAVLGSGVAVGGTSATVTGIGFTASGITANSMAAALMASEAVASGGGVAAGGMTATLQQIGAVGVMASPVGMGILAAGALVGGATYLTMHKIHQAKKAQEKACQETRVLDGNIEYNKVHTEEAENECHANAWVIIALQTQDKDDKEVSFTHRTFEHGMDAEICFLERSSTTIAKVLFDPQGFQVKSEADDATDDGLETALALYYEFAISQGLIVKYSRSLEHDTEATPLLKNAEV
jgi:hypothetical protein